jgi:hypothetical protein
MHRHEVKVPSGGTFPRVCTGFDSALDERDNVYLLYHHCYNGRQPMNVFTGNPKTNFWQVRRYQRLGNFDKLLCVRNDTLYLWQYYNNQLISFDLKTKNWKILKTWIMQRLFSPYFDVKDESLTKVRYAENKIVDYEKYYLKQDFWTKTNLVKSKVFLNFDTDFMIRVWDGDIYVCGASGVRVHSTINASRTRLSEKKCIDIFRLGNGFVCYVDADHAINISSGHRVMHRLEPETLDFVPYTLLRSKDGKLWFFQICDEQPEFACVEFDDALQETTVTKRLDSTVSKRLRSRFSGKKNMN